MGINNTTSLDRLLESINRNQDIIVAAIRKHDGRLAGATNQTIEAWKRNVQAERKTRADMLGVLERVGAWIACNVFDEELHHMDQLKAIHAIIAKAKGGD